MKTISESVDWLSEIDGMTVEGAIRYLSGLPMDRVLHYWQSSGDDQGVEISSNLQYQRPFTEQELAEFKAQRKAKEADRLERQAKYLENQAASERSRGHFAAADMHEQRAQETRQRLRDLQ